MGGGGFVAQPVQKLKTQQLRQEFAIKSDLLTTHFQQLSPLEYLQTIFNDLDAPRLYVIEGKTYATANVDELLDVATLRADVYVPPCDFFNDCYLLRTLKKLYALVIDIDGMTPMGVEQLIIRMPQDAIPTPTMIGNSGAGIHLYFVFSEAVDAYRRRIPILRGMVNALYDAFKKYGNVDHNSLIQAYRLCGCRTKLDDIMTGFRSGPKYDALTLAARLNVDTTNWEGRIDMRKPREAQDSTEAEIKKRKGKNVTVLPRVNNGHRFFIHCAQRAFNETDIGHRYTSLLALAIIAYKTRTPREELQHELKMLAVLWSERTPDNPVNLKEVDKAMRAYSPEYVRVKAVTLEEYFGWRFLRKIPRRGRTQAEHLQRCRMVKDVLIPHDKKAALEKYLKLHPDATQREIEKDLKMSPKTIVKYRRQIQGK